MPCTWTRPHEIISRPARCWCWRRSSHESRTAAPPRLSRVPPSTRPQSTHEGPPPAAPRGIWHLRRPARKWPKWPRGDWRGPSGGGGHKQEALVAVFGARYCSASSKSPGGACTPPSHERAEAELELAHAVAGAPPQDVGEGDRVRVTRFTLPARPVTCATKTEKVMPPIRYITVK